MTRLMKYFKKSFLKIDLIEILRHNTIHATKQKECILSHFFFLLKAFVV